MAKLQQDHFWPLAHAERAALADDLADLTEEQWQQRTLCEKWTVEEMVAHLTAAASLNQWKWLRSMLAARFRPDVHNQRRLAEHRGSDPAETLDRFRAIIESTTAPSGHIPAYLGEVVVHAQDIRQPLGLTRTPSVDALTPVAEFFARRNFAVPSSSRVADLQLRGRRTVRSRQRCPGHRIDPHPGHEHGRSRRVRRRARRPRCAASPHAAAARNATGPTGKAALNVKP
jgi:uncharacterized protein (TIGR03083 family)